MWVLRHEGIQGKETAVQLSGMGTLHPFRGLESAFGVSETAAGKAIRAWDHSEHDKYWHSILRHNLATGSLDGSSAKSTADTSVNRTLSLKVKPHQTGNANNPVCRRCCHERETASHIPCDFEALAEL
jgi:hypothetical protein